MGNLLTIGCRVALFSPVPVDIAHLVDVETEVAGDMLNDRFDGEHALRSTESTECRIGHRVGSAGIAARGDVLQEVAIVDMAHGAGENRRTQIGDIACPQGDRDVDTLDPASGIESCCVAEETVMAFACDDHVGIPSEPELCRPSSPCGHERGDRSDDRSLALLAAEAAAHPPHLDRDGRNREAENRRDGVLDFRWMLGGTEDFKVTVVAGHCKGNVAFEIEVILAAATNLAADPVARFGNGSVGISALHGLWRRRVGLVPESLIDGEESGPFRPGDVDKTGRLEGLVKGRGGNRRDRRSGIVCHVAGECRFTASDRADVVGPGDVGGCQHGVDAGRVTCRPRVDVDDFGMGMRGGHQNHLEGTRNFRHVIDEACPAGDVLQGAVVRGPRKHRCTRGIHAWFTSTADSPATSR